MKYIFQTVLLLLVITIISACDTKRVFDEYIPLKNQTWHKDSLVIFSVPVNDTVLNHDLYLNIRNDINYSFSNLWLFIKIEQPNGEAIRDTFEMVLADPSGKWLGKGFGGLKTREAIYRRNVYFPRSGNYTISVQQGMREQELEGITDVGLRIEKIN